jgi:hypothetical protein
MGRIANELAKKIHPQRVGIMAVLNRRLSSQSKTSVSLSEVAARIQGSATLSIVQVGSRQVVGEGCIFLSDPYTSREFMLVLLVGKTISTVCTMLPRFGDQIPSWVLDSLE